MTPLSGKVASITGANGITGNAIIEHLIRQPATEWPEIIITLRRLPSCASWQDPRVRAIALDFLKPIDELVEEMKSLCHNVTHAFFVSYVHSHDFAELGNLNVPLFQHFLHAIDCVAKNSLQRVCLQTGGKYYGVHLGPVEAPIHEQMALYEDRGENFYFAQEDALVDLASKRQWKWNVIRPIAIVGYTPAGNGMSVALTLAIYFLCCKETGEAPIFPGNKLIYHSVDDASFAPSLADMNVWAATSEKTANEAFNHTNGDSFVWKYFWQAMGSYFDINVAEMEEWEASGEDQQQMSHNFLMMEWAKDKKPIWERVVAKYGGHPNAFDWGTWDFFDWITGKAWPTIASISKARKYGWMRYDDTYDSYVETFRSFENAGVLPQPRGNGGAIKRSLTLRPHPAGDRLSG